ncbi:hypothetical protein SAMN05421779_101201 [Insolitispirillum peregrinum]|uniref:Uncharacterized protein n=1 Tax=Insolitispirillum peregrinum TaxID=80876 RepID=A0A1N7IJC1_9PROT|nr:hypothetical protein SAMN05421779_101201 [Insolitispirillum peregrinum]
MGSNPQGSLTQDSFVFCSMVEHKVRIAACTCSGVNVPGPLYYQRNGVWGLERFHTERKRSLFLVPHFPSR